MKKFLKYGFLIFCLVVAARFSHAQLSPGDLSSAHAHLEGLRNCTKCHILKEKETTAKCLACHTEIQQLLNQNRGYHSSTEAKGKKCAECHSDHHGRNFEITRFDKNTFNHDLAGYTLEGAHSQLTCTDCHKNELIKNKVSQKAGSSYLGLGTECLSCHDNYHQGQEYNNCISCHDQNSFSNVAAVAEFNHAQTRFPLVGKHLSLECESCHTVENEDGNKFKQFAGVEVGNCTLCHEDIHNNEFGSNCKQCHNENTFKRPATAAPFNHENSNYPLRGRHRRVGCRECHKVSYSQPVKHQFCADCHTDFHENQFAINDVVPDCSTCHTVQNFSPSTYKIENHNQTNFPLEGPHMATPCVSCHKMDGKWDFSDTRTNCMDCHENIHENVLAERFTSGSSCERCHSVSVWNEIKFNHSLTNFDLFGKHRQIACADCHFVKDENGNVKQQFTGLAATCESCHTDIHFKQFEIDNENDCERCHVFESWNPTKFNHNTTRFKLDGEHVGLECVQCHKPSDKLIQNYIIYKIDDLSCASCH